MTGRRIYLASSWRNTFQPEMVKLLRGAGHAVYDFRNPAPGDCGFHWSAIDPAWEQWSTVHYARAIETHPLAREGFAKDINALDWCDTCVLLQPCGISANLELGYAAGRGKTTIVRLNGDRFEPELMYLMVNHRVCTDDELIEILARPA